MGTVLVGFELGIGFIAAKFIIGAVIALVAVVIAVATGEE